MRNQSRRSTIPFTSREDSVRSGRSNCPALIADATVNLTCDRLLQHDTQPMIGADIANTSPDIVTKGFAQRRNEQTASKAFELQVQWILTHHNKITVDEGVTEMDCE